MVGWEYPINPRKASVSSPEAVHSENRTESYYGGGRPTEEQAHAMAELANAAHQFVVSQIREGGVCLCNT